jgi:mannose-1-phosphate guanylyltransferase
VVLGEGAWVEKGAAVRDAVIWAGTRVKEGERVEGGIAAGELRVKG